MIILPDGSPASPLQILAAMTEEAKKRRTTYGRLRGALTLREEVEIVLKWWEAHNGAD